MSFVRTILGDISPERLGITLPHEHLLLDNRKLFVEPKEASSKHWAYQPIALENLDWIRRNYTSNVHNVGLLDEGFIIQELKGYQRAGGCSLVEVTTQDRGRDPRGLVRISRAVGLNVIMGTGYHEEVFHPSDLKGKDEEEVVEELVRDVVEGVDDTGLKSGIIGEIGCSWPLMDSERKVLRASAKAQRITGAPLTIHPGRHPKSPLELLSVIDEAGGVVERTILGHLDRTIFDITLLKQLAKMGCYLEFDMFGVESAYYPFAQTNLPNDGTRLETIVHLIDSGYSHQVLISQNISFKTQLTRYGGHGYAHILENVVPMMRRKGLGKEEIRQMLEINPQRILTFA